MGMNQGCEIMARDQMTRQKGSGLICSHISQHSEKRGRVKVRERRRGETEIGGIQACGTAD